MTVKRFQNKIAESRLTLPLVSIYGIIVCVAWGLLDSSFADTFWKDWRWIAQVVLLSVSTVLMVELNNSNALIRVYSRMVSCSFLVLTLMAAFLLPSLEGSVVGLSFIVFYLFFLRAYQDKQAVGSIYAAFLAIGIGSLFFVQLLYFLPVLWLMMGSHCDRLAILVVKFAFHYDIGVDDISGQCSRVSDTKHSCHNDPEISWLIREIDDADALCFNSIRHIFFLRKQEDRADDP